MLMLKKYRVKNIVAVQHGFRIFIEDHLAEAPLNRHVQNINLIDGSLLGVSHDGQVFQTLSRTSRQEVKTCSLR